ncbi:Putative uncharacterized protein [Propionibacterium freudenreichii]|uniref:hypothetical protein n=1 Tax=Propionibacterium freudenreichii TaxID=1744 RepID=UPI0005A5CCF5|nr:hypothetical protein [Propionibacterium freudenreichii]CEI28266.1 Putative uncharacterized protein [Propionibacterium freudenreichii]
MAALLVVLLVAASSLVLGTAPAQAGSRGVGYENSQGFIGAYETDVDGRQAYCIDLGAASPFGQTSGPHTVTSLDSLSRQQLAELNYVLDRWGQSSDPDVTAAVAIYVWSVADASTYASIGGADYLVARAPASARDEILANVAVMRQEASVNAVTDPSLSLDLSMQDQYAGTLSISAHPASLQGTATLTDAVFAGGDAARTLGIGQHQIAGTPANGAASYRIEASMSVDAAGYGAKVDLYTTGDAQRLVAAVAGSSTGLSATARTPVIELDFQPEIGTEVASRFVAEGDAFVDELAVTVTKGTWITVDGRPVPVTATGTLYGPFDEQPAEADAPPGGAPVAGVEEVTLTGVGSYISPGTTTAPESGFFTWVWAMDKTSQGINGKYLAGSFTDRFGRVAKTNVVPFQPKAVSEADQHLAVPGDALTDTIEVSSSNGAWLKRDGEFIPVVFEGTAYQVPGTLPPTQGGEVPAGAVALGTVTVTATGPGVYASPAVVAPTGGFVTWVWELRKASQPQWVRDYLAADWTDEYGIPLETTSVRWPVTTTSLMREYNVHSGGRAFDTVTVTGFPANHGEFTGDGYWEADVDELVHTVYGPFDTDAVLTDDLDLTGAPVLTSITTPARNGVYRLGYTDADRITPTEAGYYVLVTTFAGDDRVQPYSSSPADVLERFYVPTTPEVELPVAVITQATPAALVGGPFGDAALVQGTIPEGTTLVFRAYGPQPADADPVCEVAFFESDPIPVSQAGVYTSPATSVDQPGNVYWIETLYDQGGGVLVEGTCGAPGETTVITEQPETLTVTTMALAEVALGQPAHDTAKVTGTVPDGTTLTFKAYRQEDDTATCTPGELVFASDPIEVTGPGEYESSEVVFDRAGTYYWIETVYDADGTMIHQGLCGAPDETTTVTSVPPAPSEPTPPAPEVPGTPDRPTGLAQTGASGVLPLGIAGGVFALAGALALWFGRRLALYRERNGYVREEDQEFLDLTDHED